MSEQVLIASSGRVKGSPGSRRMRTSGEVPGVVYGGGTEPVAVSFNAHELRAVMSKQQLLGRTVTLDLNGTKSQVIVKEIQRHPVRQDVLHVDCQVIKQP